MEYFIKEKDGGLESDQLYRNKFTTNRIGKVSSVLYKKKPCDLLPFKGKFPLVDPNDQKVFLDKTMETHLYKDCSDAIKSVVVKAEKIVFIHDAFCDFLDLKAMSKADFKSKNPKTKQDLLYSFLFSNCMDIGVLEI
jgi:hypothetical protein